GRALRIGDEQRIAHFHAYAPCVGGWALGASGESEKGLAQISQGGGQLRSWGEPTYAAGVAGRRAIGDRQIRSGTRIGGRRAGAGGKGGGSAAWRRALCSPGGGIA